MSRLVALVQSIRRHAWWHRRAVAALAAGVAVLCLGATLSPPPPRTVGVVVAGRDLPSGTVLRAEDLTIRQVPPDVPPDRVILDPASLMGRTVAAPVVQGAMLTEVSVVSPALAAAAPDRAMVPVRLAVKEVSTLLRVGDQVDVVRPGDGGTVVARRARVVALPQAPSGGGLVSAPGGGPMVVLEVRRSEAGVLAGGQSQPFSVVLL